MNILEPLKLLLPALLPSWNFFDIIAPSPRIQFTLKNSQNGIHVDWQEFRPRADHLSVIQMLKRIFWNPTWNESLYLVSCAERIKQKHNIFHSENEILKRIEKNLIANSTDPYKIANSQLQFRLIFIKRKNTQQQEVAFLSRIQKITVKDKP